MCRYAVTDYRSHWVCLPCRYTAKHRQERAVPRCPRCRAGMTDLGRDFQPPRRRDLRQWRKVALLVQVGLRFHSCGCTGPGPRPGTLADARSALGPRRKGTAPRLPHRVDPYAVW